jgi:kynurenine formamidase
MSEMIDVSHTIEHGMITYKGLPAPVIHDFLTRETSRKIYAPGTEFHIGSIEMVANTGTYLDSPFHRYADGADLSELPLSSLANLEGFTVRISNDEVKAIGPSVFEGFDVRGRAVLVHTGWSRHWRTESYYANHPFLTRATAEFLVNEGAALVGIDSYNIDDITDPARPAHSMLLKAGIPIVEHLSNLDSLPESGFRFFAVPVKVKSFGTFPVRAFAIID